MLIDAAFQPVDSSFDEPFENQKSQARYQFSSFWTGTFPGKPGSPEPMLWVASISSLTLTSTTTMVSVTVSLKGKATINCDFPAKHPNDVTVRDLKAAVQAKFPKVSPPPTDVFFGHGTDQASVDGLQSTAIDLSAFRWRRKAAASD